MRVINKFDELGRYRGTIFILDKPAGQIDSHGHSYLWCRREYELMGWEMALGKEEIDEIEAEKIRKIKAKSGEITLDSLRAEQTEGLLNNQNP